MARAARWQLSCLLPRLWDVGPGILLSSELVSNLVTVAAATVSSVPIKTFTIGVPGSALDETKHAQLVADAFGTEHHWQCILTERRRVQNLMAQRYLLLGFELNRKQGFSVPMDEWMRAAQVEE